MNKTFTRVGLALAVVIVTLSLMASVGALAQEEMLYAFMGGTDGGNPNAVILGADGNIYGAALYGGTSDEGVIYQLMPAASGPWTENLLYTFTDGHDSGFANRRLTVDAAGNVYGTTAGGGVSIHFWIRHRIQDRAR